MKGTKPDSRKKRKRRRRIRRADQKIRTAARARSRAGELVVDTYETEIMGLQTEGGGKVSFTINAAGQVYKQAIEFVYSGGLSSQTEALALK